MRVSVISAISGLLALHGGAHAATPAPLSFKDTIRYATEHSPVLDSARKTLEIRGLEFSTSIARMLPSLDIGATQGILNNIPIGGNNALLTPNATSPWYSALTAGVSETLYDNGVSITQALIADLNQDLAAVGFERTRAGLALDVSQEFYSFSLATALLDVRKQQQELLEKQFKSVSSQYQQGFKTKSDYLRLRAQVQRAEIERINAENRILVSTAQLRKLIGEDTPVAFTPLSIRREDDPLRGFPKGTAGLEKTYDFRLSKIQREINDKNVSFAVRRYWPQISVTSALTYTNFGYINSPTPFNETGQFSWNALLSLQFNVWDWGIRRREVQAARYNRDVQDNTLEQSLLEARAQLTTLRADMDRIARNYRLNRELLSLEEESYSNLELQYREGRVAYLDLITGLNNLLDAKTQYYASHFEALRALARHRYFEGTLYEALSES
jgi:outer membrane protein TolC